MPLRKLAKLYYRAARIARLGRRNAAPPQPIVAEFRGKSPSTLVATALMIVSLYPVPRLTAQQGTTNTVSASTGTGVALATAANYQVRHSHTWQDYENVMILATLNGAAKQAAATGRQLTEDDYLKLANQTQDWLNKRAPDSQFFLSKDQAGRLRYATDVLMAITTEAPAVGGIVSALWGGLEKLKIDQLESTLNPKRQAAADREFYDLAIKGTQFASARVQEWADLAAADPALAAAGNVFVRPWLGCDTNCSYDDVKQLYPTALPTVQTNPDKSVTVDTTKSLTDYDTAVANVRAATEDDLADLKTVVDYQLDQGFPINTSMPPLPPGNTDDPAARQANRQVQLDAAHSIINGIGMLIGLSNPQLGNQIQTVGSATIQVGEAVSKYLNTVETLGPGLAGAALTGNIIMAAVGIFSLFEGGSSPDQTVLQEIQQLSTQIKDLRDDMDRRFNSVDATLNTILDTLNTNFSQIDYQLGVLHGDAHTIETGLLDIQADLNRLEQYLFAWTTSLSRQQLDLAFNECLGYLARTGQDIGFTQYQNCENQFYTWAHDTASNELWAGLASPDYSDGNLYNTLTNFPLSVNINYLAQYPGQSLGLPVLSSTRLSNPNEWSVGARAYLQLAYEWPQYAMLINSSRVDDLIQVGTFLQSAVHAANSAGSGATIQMNQALFTSAVNKYNTALGSLQPTIQADVDSFVADPSNHLANPSNTSQTLNLWAGPTQSSTSYIPPALTAGTLPGCSGDPNSYTMSPNLVTLLPSVIVNAAQLQLTTVTPCMAFSQISAGYFGARYHWDLQTFDVQLNTSTNGTVLYQVIYAIIPSGACGPDIWNNGTCFGAYSDYWPYYTISQSPLAPVCSDLNVCMCSTLGDSGKYWRNTSAEFAAFFNQNTGLYICGYYTTGNPLASMFVPNSSTASPPSADVLAAFSASITREFQQYQQTLYGQIAIDVKSGAAAPATDLVSGAKLLIQAYTNLGLEGSLQNTEGLRGLLYGNGSLLDSANLQSDFAGFSTGTIQDTSDNKVTDELNVGTSRSTALTAAFAAALNTIQVRGTPDSLDQVDSTLADLQAFETLKNNGALPPCTYQLSSGLGSASNGGGTATFSVTTQPGCTVPASSRSDWISVSQTPLAPSLVQVSVGIATNSTGLTRSGAVLVGDQFYRVLQGTGLQPGPGPTSGLTFVPVTPCRVADTRYADGPFGGPLLTANTARDFTIPAGPCGIPATAQAYSLNIAVVPNGKLGFLTAWPTGQPQPTASTLNSLDGRTKSNAAIVQAGAGGAITIFVKGDTHVILDINGYFIPNTDPSGLAFYPLTPCRVVDTRFGSGPLAGPRLSAGEVRDVPVLSSTCGIPPTARAYSLNFAVVPKGNPVGYLTAWPSGQVRPLVSTLNATTGTVVANAAIMPAGVNGNVSLYTTGQTDLVMDVNGYFAPAGTGGLSFYALTPCRVVDTRLPSGAQPSSGELDVNVTASACAIPSGAGAYVFNTTVVPPGPLIYLTLWPNGQSLPNASNLNAFDGAVTSNMALVPSSNGFISLWASDLTYVILDITGYFAP